MKLVYRLLLLLGLLLSVAAPYTGVAETAAIRPLPVFGLQVERKIHAIDGTEIGHPGAHILGFREAPELADAIFEVEPEDRKNPESNFSRKLAEVTGYFTSYLDPVAAYSFLNPNKCSPVCGHFSFCSRRFIALCVIRV